jgi:hypothetical protein
MRAQRFNIIQKFSEGLSASLTFNLPNHCLSFPCTFLFMSIFTCPVCNAIVIFIVECFKPYFPCYSVRHGARNFQKQLRKKHKKLM